ncbi:hypothetical protein BDY19DRAFT_910687 [Irpex rosettiformis]|uniref:Uncharacterized protein n=1 Tax=Irpex rosettiformis TaxID=378272 RepID=A0ACB8TMV4_9APHY|nr:hypothetical protein BDY19DRAFT_910687 [Irpex rosettiformis]
MDQCVGIVRTLLLLGRLCVARISLVLAVFGHQAVVLNCGVNVAQWKASLLIRRDRMDVHMNRSQRNLLTKTRKSSGYRSISIVRDERPQGALQEGKPGSVRHTVRGDASTVTFGFLNRLTGPIGWQPLSAHMHYVAIVNGHRLPDCVGINIVCPKQRRTTHIALNASSKTVKVENHGDTATAGHPGALEARINLLPFSTLTVYILLTNKLNTLKYRGLGALRIRVESFHVLNV